VADVRTFKLTRTNNTRNTCPYSSVACGLIISSLGDKAEIIHTEGDPDHPVNWWLLVLPPPYPAGPSGQFPSVPFLRAAMAFGFCRGQAPCG
jgi:hypothetical protein